MSVTALLGHPGPWTFDDLERLPDDGNRYEVVEGTLVVSPAPSEWHQEVALRLLLQLRPQAHPDWRAVYEVALTTGGDGRVPDLALIRGDRPVLRTGRRSAAADFGLVIEVVSPSSRGTDRLVKPVEYAAAGVPYFWRIEIEPTVELFAYELVDGAYVERLHLTAGSAVVPAPCPITVDLDDLCRP